MSTQNEQIGDVFVAWQTSAYDGQSHAITDDEFAYGAARARIKDTTKRCVATTCAWRTRSKRLATDVLDASHFCKPAQPRDR